MLLKSFQIDILIAAGPGQARDTISLWETVILIYVNQSNDTVKYLI